MKMKSEITTVPLTFIIFIKSANFINSVLIKLLDINNNIYLK